VCRNVLCVRQTRRATLWSYNSHQDGNQTSFHANPLVGDQLILVGTDKNCAPGAIGHVYAFDQKTGSVRWKYRTAGTPTNIVRIGSTIYSSTFIDELIALNISDGRLGSVRLSELERHILGWDRGADRTESTCTLAFDPLACSFQLKGALGEIVDNAVSSDVRFAPPFPTRQRCQSS